MCSVYYRGTTDGEGFKPTPSVVMDGHHTLCETTQSRLQVDAL